MPDHLDFLKQAVNLHSLTCELALIADNGARLTGMTFADSIKLTLDLLERFKCSIS